MLYPIELEALNTHSYQLLSTLQGPSTPVGAICHPGGGTTQSESLSHPEDNRHLKGNTSYHSFGE